MNVSSRQSQVVGETPCVALDEAPSRCERTPGEEEESGLRVTPPTGLSPPPSHQEENTEDQRLQFLVREEDSSILFLRHLNPPACTFFLMHMSGNSCINEERTLLQSNLFLLPAEYSSSLNAVQTNYICLLMLKSYILQMVIKYHQHGFQSDSCTHLSR